MPFKIHAARHHKFAKCKHRVTNWAEYNESLRWRADISVWIDESVVHTGTRTELAGTLIGIANMLLRLAFLVR